jgi:hypothetical protein
VVDVPVPSDPGLRDLVVVFARFYGATPEGSLIDRGTLPETLYVLMTWNRDDDPEHVEVAITTLRKFFALNPADAAYIREHHPDPTVPSAFSGGGGAAPSWRLERTSYVGRKA